LIIRDFASHSKTRTIHVVFQNEVGSFTVTELDMESQDDLRELLRSEGCSGLIQNETNKLVTKFHQLVPGTVYNLFGGRMKAALDQREWQQLETKVMEHLAAVAVQRTFCPIGSKIHRNIVFKRPDGKIDDFELDAVIIHEGQGSDGSTAFIVESSRSPKPSEVSTLLSKVEKLKSAAASSHQLFRTVTRMVPVLAGRHWDEEVVRACEAAGVIRVFPAGTNYECNPQST
jgi:hypothetical protein